MRHEKPRAKYVRTLPGIGDVYFLNFAHATEMAHPFTTMSNWWGDATLPVFARGSIDAGNQLNKVCWVILAPFGFTRSWK